MSLSPLSGASWVKTAMFGSCSRYLCTWAKTSLGIRVTEYASALLQIVLAQDLY